MRFFSRIPIGAAVLIVSLLAAFQQDPAPAIKKAPDGGRYIGAAACKTCHAGAAKGDAHAIWEKTAHARAYATLGTDKAKAVAKELGIADPQKSGKCLKCHVTAYGVAKAELKARFRTEDGVQCESCHGRGEAHFRARMKAKPDPVAAGEIGSGRAIATCKQCHNEESPTFEPFCLAQRMKPIEHLDPRKERSDEELAKLRNTCVPDCVVCGKENEDKKENKEKKDGDGR